MIGVRSSSTRLILPPDSVVEMFKNSSNVAVHGNATNIVRGDQHNRSVVVTISFPRKGPKPKKSGEYGQFHEIIRGDIRFVRELYTEAVVEEEERWMDKLSRLITRKNVVHTVQRTVYTAELNSSPNQKFTIMTFQGQRARRLWKKDFLKLSQIQSSYLLQLFGINRSEIPALIFYGGNRVFFFSAEGQVCYGLIIIQATMKLNGTLLCSIKVEQTGCVITLPAAAVTKES